MICHETDFIILYQLCRNLLLSTCVDICVILFPTIICQCFSLRSWWSAVMDGWFCSACMCVRLSIPCPSVCQLWQLAGSLEGDFTVCMAACLFPCLSVSPLGLSGELARVADVPLSQWRTGVEIFLGRQRCRVGHSGTRHLGHQGLWKVNNEFSNPYVTTCCHFKDRIL